MKVRFSVTVLISLLLSLSASAQTSVTPRSQIAQIDQNKSAIIINGAGGEEEYATQFEKWTKDLGDALKQRYGFDPAKVKILTEKPAISDEMRSTR